MPGSPHKNGVVEKTETDIVISEIPTLEAYYDALVLPTDLKVDEINIDIKRRHAQIQIALYFIGKQLGFRTWIAQNDKGILYQNKRLGEFDGVIARLDEERLIQSHHDAINAALLIDCIWFKNGRLMPAVMEIEHSTGVTSGLTRMKNFFDKFPPFLLDMLLLLLMKTGIKLLRRQINHSLQTCKQSFFLILLLKSFMPFVKKENYEELPRIFLIAIWRRLSINFNLQWLNSNNFETIRHHSNRCRSIGDAGSRRGGG